MDPAFEFVFQGTAFFTIVLLLWRVHQLERELVAERKRAATASRTARVSAVAMSVADINPAEYARSAVQTHKGLAHQRDVGVHMVVDETPPARTNTRLLDRCLRHLVRTAIQSAPEGRGDVTVGVGLLPADGEPTHVGFAIADDGPGIEAARLVRILEPSIEPGAPRTTEERAYAVVHALARAMGAKLVIDSAPGTGTRATLKVPLAHAPRNAQPRTKQKRPAQKARRVERVMGIEPT